MPILIVDYRSEDATNRPEVSVPSEDKDASVVALDSSY